MENKHKIELLNSVSKCITDHRRLILDAMEQEAGHSERWAFLRKRLLTYLGEKGLEGEIMELLGKSNIEK